MECTYIWRKFAVTKDATDPRTHNNALTQSAPVTAAEGCGSPYNIDNQFGLFQRLQKVVRRLF